MKVSTVLFALVCLFFLTSGCSLVPYVSPQERCAARGMALGGVAESQGYSSGVAYVGGRAVVAHGSSYGQTAFCREFTRNDDPCLQAALLASALIKSDFNLYGRKVVVAIGYCLLIVPGIIAHIAYHANATGAEKRAFEKFNEVLNQCRQEMRGG